MNISTSRFGYTMNAMRAANSNSGKHTMPRHPKDYNNAVFAFSIRNTRTSGQSLATQKTSDPVRKIPFFGFVIYDTCQ